MQDQGRAVGEDNRAVEALESGPAFWLRDLATAGIEPKKGVYSLWYARDFLYVGIAKHNLGDVPNPQNRGVPGRLATYRRCRLTSDFAIGIFVRYVVPELDDATRVGLREGTLGVREMQARTRAWVAENVQFRCHLTENYARIEQHIRTHGLPKAGRPLFNPANGADAA